MTDPVAPSHALFLDVEGAVLKVVRGNPQAVRLSLASELVRRAQQRLLPGTPETKDLAALFGLLFQPDDLPWMPKVNAQVLSGHGPMADIWHAEGAVRSGMLRAYRGAEP